MTTKESLDLAKLKTAFAKISKEKENESQTGSTSLTRSISVVTPSPRRIPARNTSMGRGNSELNNLNSSAKDPTGFRLNSKQKLRKATTETSKKRRIDLAYAEAVSTHQDFGIAKVGKKKGKSLRSICDEVGGKYGVVITRSSAS